MKLIDLLLLAQRNVTGLRAPAPALVSGTNLIANGSMETGDPPSSWSAGTGATLSSVADPRTGSTGTKSMNVQRGSVSSVASRAFSSHTVGKWYTWTMWVRNVDSTSGVGASITNTLHTGSVPPSPGVASTTWTQLAGSVRCSASTPSLVCLIYDNGNGRFDDAAVYELSIPSLFRLAAGSINVDIAANVTRPSSGYYQAGLVARCDSKSAPQNFVQALMTNSAGVHQVILVKCVGGTYSTVQAATAITYAEAAPLRVVCNGTSVSVYYNGTQVGTTQTVDDAGIVSNTLHGLFSTEASARFDHISVTSSDYYMLFSNADNSQYTALL